MNELFVTNNTGSDHVDMYNGKQYAFPAGEKTLVPMDAAFHMFGFGKKDKTENLIRVGKANLPNDEGAKWLAKFVFTEPVMIERPAEEPTDGSLPDAAAA